MASVLSLMVMSGLKSSESRLLSKQRLSKKTTRKSGSHNRSRQHVIPCLLVGWFWSNRIWLGGLLWLLASQPAGQPAQARPGFLILVTCMGCGICWKGVERRGAKWFGMPLCCSKEKCITPNKCGLNLCPLQQAVFFFPLLLFSKSWLSSTPVAKQRGNWGKQGERGGDGVGRTGGKWCNKKTHISHCC